MARDRGAGAAAWWMAAAAAAGLVVAAIQYVRKGSGVDHTGGALLVIVSTALLLAAALALAFMRRALASGGNGWRTLLAVLSLLDILGTGAAAWFLHAWILLALMVVAFVAWLLVAVSPRDRAAPSPPARSAA